MSGAGFRMQEAASTLTFDLDHAGATIAVGAIAGLRQPAEMRDVDAFAPSDLPNGLTRPGRHHISIECE
jgi:hypothetical protein